MKLFKPTLVALSLVAVMGCQQEAKKEEEKAVVLETEAQKQAYSLGAQLGDSMKQNLAQFKELSVELDQEIVLQGYLDGLAGKTTIEKEEVRALLGNLEQTLMAKKQEQDAAKAKAALEAGQKYLDENAKKEGVQVTESGIQYQVITEGTGEKPTATDMVIVHYVGTLINGDEFDSSVKRGEPAKFRLNQVIAGWTEGVQLMSVGSKFKFTIPAHLAYGERATHTIPANSVLNFEVELLEIVKPKEPIEVGE